MATTTTSTTTTPPPPAFIGTTISDFCSVLGRPQILTGIFRDILQRQFAHERYLQEPSLKDLIWQPGERTHILIETAHRWRPELTQKRPAVIVKRNSYTWRRYGIGDQAQAPHLDQRGDEHFEGYWIGSHTLFCIAGSGAQVELLASEVERHFTQFAPAIRRTLNLHRLQPLQSGSVSVLEEAKENFAVPVSVGYAFVEKWVLREQAPLLSNISMTAIIEC